jgi:hypothetical protein
LQCKYEERGEMIDRLLGRQNKWYHRRIWDSCSDLVQLKSWEKKVYMIGGINELQVRMLDVIVVYLAN